jgi:hypothetical protein
MFLAIECTGYTSCKLFFAKTIGFIVAPILQTSFNLLNETSMVWKIKVSSIFMIGEEHNL